MTDSTRTCCFMTPPHDRLNRYALFQNHTRLLGSASHIRLWCLNKHCRILQSSTHPCGTERFWLPVFDQITLQFKTLTISHVTVGLQSEDATRLSHPIPFRVGTSQSPSPYQAVRPTCSRNPSVQHLPVRISQSHLRFWFCRPAVSVARWAG